ncbi:MAG: hypothetical protein AB1566_05175 [Chloroflexota bacterium]
MAERDKAFPYKASGRAARLSTLVKKLSAAASGMNMSATLIKHSIKIQLVIFGVVYHSRKKWAKNGNPS